MIFLLLREKEQMRKWNCCAFTFLRVANKKNRFLKKCLYISVSFSQVNQQEPSNSDFCSISFPLTNTRTKQSVILGVSDFQIELEWLKKLFIICFIPPTRLPPKWSSQWLYTVFYYFHIIGVFLYFFVVVMGSVLGMVMKVPSWVR